MKSLTKYLSEKLIINKDYKVTYYNSFTDVDEIYVILFDNFGGRNLLFNTYKVYDHDCDEEKSIIKFSSAVSIFNQWGISATSMYDKENDIAYIINKDSTYIIFSDKNIEKLELLLSLMKKLINTDYSITSILNELGIDNGIMGKNSQKQIYIKHINLIRMVETMNIKELRHI